MSSQRGDVVSKVGSGATLVDLRVGPVAGETTPSTDACVPSAVHSEEMCLLHHFSLRLVLQS